MRLPVGVDADAEQILRGEAPPGADAELIELAALARELRTAYAVPPPEAVGERQLAAIVAEAADASAGSAIAVDRDLDPAATRRPPARRGRTLGFRLAATGLAALLATTGLAIAGVKPPAPLGDALERVGIGGGEEATKPPAGAGGGASGAPGASEGVDAAGEGAGGQLRRRGEARERQAGGGASRATQGESGARSTGDQSRSETGTTNSAPGRTTADEARAGQTPPQSPGRSGENAPAGTGPPALPGVQGLGAERGKSQSEDRSAFGQDRAQEARERGGLP